MRRYGVLGCWLLLMVAQAHAAEDLETAYKERIRWCTGNAKGTMAVLATSVTGQLNQRLPTLNLPKYCECYWGRRRDKFGLKTTIYMTTMIGTLPGDPTLEAARAFQDTYTGTWEWMQTEEEIQGECVRMHSQPLPAPPNAPQLEARYRQLIQTCKQNPASIVVQSTPGNRAAIPDSSRYCECYYPKLLEEFGLETLVELASSKTYEEFVEIFQNKEELASSGTKIFVFEAKCLAEQGAGP